MKLKIPYWPLLLGPTLALATGFILNVAVVGANHSQMPVLLAANDSLAEGDIKHCVMTANTHLKFLADWIYVGFGIASPGDLFIFLYQATFIPSLVTWAAFIIKDKSEGR